MKWLFGNKKMIGNIMYGISGYKIYVIHVKIRNIRKIRITWYCYE